MNNFETRYTVVGTSALKDGVSESRAQASIIKFPSLREGRNPQHAARATRENGKTAALEFANELRTGSARGKAFNRIAPWQSVSAGLMLAAVAAATIFLGL